MFNLVLLKNSNLTFETSQGGNLKAFLCDFRSITFRVTISKGTGDLPGAPPNSDNFTKSLLYIYHIYKPRLEHCCKKNKIKYRPMPPKYGNMSCTNVLLN